MSWNFFWWCVCGGCEDFVDTPLSVHRLLHENSITFETPAPLLLRGGAPKSISPIHDLRNLPISHGPEE